MEGSFLNRREFIKGSIGGAAAIIAAGTESVESQEISPGLEKSVNEFIDNLTAATEEQREQLRQFILAHNPQRRSLSSAQRRIIARVTTCHIGGDSEVTISINGMNSLELNQEIANGSFNWEQFSIDFKNTCS